MSQSNFNLKSPNSYEVDDCITSVKIVLKMQSQTDVKIWGL